MKILQINSVCGIRSTGRICTDIAELLKGQGDECIIAYGREHVPKKYQDIAVRIGTDFDTKLHGIQSRILDNTGFASKKATCNFVRWVTEYNPDIIHLHNLHGYYINIEVLFDYLARAGKPVVWTLHDCWAFTGHCAYFDFAGCSKWITHCRAPCPNKKEYPRSFLLDRSYHNFEDKRKLFTSVKNINIVVPSKWLAELVKQSFLRRYPVHVIPNGIDLSVFKPTPSNFLQTFGLDGKTILLAVASVWDKRKGYDDLLVLAGMLDNSCQLVIVGLSEKQKQKLPDNIIGILKTNSASELAQLYSAADVFLNPTYEDNFPTVNLEALACGTPIITYNSGGSPECVDKLTGIVLDKKGPQYILGEIDKAKMLNQSDCVRRAQNFERDNQYNTYKTLYKRCSDHSPESA